MDFVKEWSRIFISLETMSSIEHVEALKEKLSASTKKEVGLFEFGSQEEDEFSCSHEDLPISFPRKRFQRQQDHEWGRKKPILIFILFFFFYLFC